MEEDDNEGVIEEKILFCKLPREEATAFYEVILPFVCFSSLYMGTIALIAAKIDG